MKKLRFVLITLLAVILSLGLIACRKKGSGNEGENPGGDEGDNPGGNEQTTTLTIQRVVSVRLDGAEITSIDLTDADSESTLTEELSSAKVRVRTNDGNADIGISACTVNSTSVTFGKVGTYQITVTPKTEGDYSNPSNLSASLNVVVSHNFVDKDGILTCTKDGATLTKKTINTDLTYFRFHDGDYVLKGADDDGVKAFGDIMVNGVSQRVKTTTVGRLAKGMSITIKGTAITNYSKYVASDAGYYFPIIGFADASLGSYAGGAGTSIIVRNEGWVLRNGIGSPRLLAAIAGGQDDSNNYGSHPNDTAAKPDGYSENGEPALADWINWHVYATGTPSNSSTYETKQNIELTWTYYDTGVIEMIYANTTLEGEEYSLIIRTKVPDSPKGYYDTILHGEFVEMHFEEISTIQETTLTDVHYKGMKEDAKKVYLENEMFDLSSLNVTISTEQSDSELTDTQFDVEANIGTAQSPNWVSLSSEPLNRTDMKAFRVIRRLGNVVKYAEIPADFITIKTNALDRATPYTVEKDSVTYANNSTLKTGAVGASTVGSDTYAAFAVTGTAASAAGSKHVALRLWAREGSTSFVTNTSGVTVKSGDAAVSANDYILVSGANGKYVDLVIKFQGASAAGLITNGVVISGLSEGGVPVKIDLTGVDGTDVVSAVTKNSLPLNKGGEVTVVYTFSQERMTAMTTAVGGALPISLTTIGVGSATVRFNEMTANGDVYTGKIADKYDVRATVNTAARTITVVYGIPAFTVTNIEQLELSISAYDGGTEITLAATDTVYYDLAFDTTVNDGAGYAIDNRTYVEAAKTDEGNMLYIAVIGAQTTQLITDNIRETSLNLILNNGTVDSLQIFDLSYYFSNSILTFYNDALLPTDFANYKLVTFGTLDNNDDTDYGMIVILTINLNKLDVEFKLPYYFEISRTGDARPTYVLEVKEQSDAAKMEKHAVSFTASDNVLIAEGDCLTKGYSGYVYKVNNEPVFYAGLREIGGMHSFENGICTHCGATSSTGNLTGEWWTSALSGVLTEGHFFDFTAVYKSAGSNLDGTMALAIEENKGNKSQSVFNMNGSGYGEHATVTEDNADVWATRLAPHAVLAADATDEDKAAVEEFNKENSGVSERFSNSLITPAHPYNTINGSLDSSGIPIDAATLHRAMVNGTVRYTVVYSDGVITVRMRLYEEGVALSQKPYFDFHFTIVTDSGCTYNVLFTGQDGHCTLIDDMGEMVSGKLLDSVLVSGETITSGDYHSDLSFGTPSFNGSIATIEAEGTATKLTTEPALGTATHYAAMRLNFLVPLVESTQISIDGGARAELANGGRSIDVIVPMGAAISTKQFNITLTNMEASTIQCPIRIDVSKVIVSELNGIVESNLTVLGGTFSITLEGAIESTMKLKVNGVTKALTEIEEDMAYGDGLKVKTADFGTATITFERTAMDYTKKISGYTVELLKADDTVLVKKPVTVSSDVTALEDVTIVDDAAVLYSGSKMILLVSGVNRLDTTEVSLNANKGARSEVKMLGYYSLAFHVDRDGVATLRDTNTLSTASTTKVVYSEINGGVVAITVDLAALGISAGDAYGYELKIASGNTVMYLVGADRTAAVLGDVGVASDIEKTCTTFAKSAKKYPATGDVEFYYDVAEVAITAPTHTWELQEDNHYMCSVCHSVFHPNDAKKLTLEYPDDGDPSPSFNLDGVSENGLTVSFWGCGDSSQDWNIQTLTTVAGNLVIMMPNLGGGAKKASTLSQGLKEDEEFMATFNKIADNCWPDGHSTKHNGAIWSSLDNISCYITIVIDPNAGVNFYRNGILMIEYKNATRGNKGNWTVGDFVTAFLACAEDSGIIFGNANLKVAENVIIQPEALNAAQVATRYENYQLEKNVLPGVTVEE